ncbi:MAG: hypothetical protein HY591_00960, partial [Candidatus Omnitrophica bacterium]|nr:hypothetical protein [Candidatus Omnitrophota bacterium]
VFIVSLFAVNLVLNLGFFISIFSGNVFEQTAVFIYRALALVFAALGGVFFYDWALLLKGKDRQSLLTTRLFQSGMSSPKFKLIYAAVIGLAGVMSVLSSIWPANYYITLVGNNLYLPGRFLGTAGFLALYASVQMWLIVFLAALFSWGRVTPRLRQVMSAAVFLSAAVAIIYIS